MNNRILAYLSLTTTSLVWSAGAVLIKYSLSFTTPYTFLFWRFLLVSWIFLPFLIIRLKKENFRLKDLPRLFFLGFLATTATLAILFWGMNYTSAVEAVIINSLAPVFIILGGALFLHEEITGKEKIGAILAFSGSLFIIIQPILGNGHLAFGNLKGNLLVFLSVIIWAFYSLSVRQTCKRMNYSPFLLTAIAFLSGLITITPFFLLQKNTGGLFYINPQALPAILYMSILGSCIAYLTYNIGFALIEASEATLFTYLQPVFSVPLAVIFLHEKINPLILVGAVLIISGVILTEYRKKIL